MSSIYRPALSTLPGMGCPIMPARRHPTSTVMYWGAFFMYNASGARVRRKARRQRSSGLRYYALQSLIGSDQDIVPLDAATFVNTGIFLVRLLLLCQSLAWCSKLFPYERGCTKICRSLATGRDTTEVMSEPTAGRIQQHKYRRLITIMRQS
jgi:hypothetical protein